MSGDDVVAAVAGESAWMAKLLADLEDADWARESRCPGWTVADVVTHVAQTNELAVASLDGTFAEVAGRFANDVQGPTIDDVVDGMVARERGVSSADVHRRWTSAVETLNASLAAADLHRRVPWVSGEITVQTLAATRLAEMWIHGGDVAAAVGAEQLPTERLRPIARLAWRTLPYAFSRAGRQLGGPVAVELTAPDGDIWSFVPDAPAATTISGPALDFCLVAARRVDHQMTALHGDGPDASAALELVRTYA
jgi:uncharacterized protein (TIGR03084 family)